MCVHLLPCYGLVFVCRLSVCVCVCVCVCIYTISFLRLCICVYSYICMCPCLSSSLSPCLSPRPPDSQAVLTLASPYAVGKGQILTREEMREGINEEERGHRCQRGIRVWILSCTEHVRVALCSQGKDKEESKRSQASDCQVEREREREREQEREGVAGLSWSMAKWRGNGSVSLSLSWV